MSIQNLQSCCAGNGIELKGSENMPEFRLGNLLFENPWNHDDDSLYVAKKAKIVIAKRGEDIWSLNKVSDDYSLLQHSDAVLKCAEHLFREFPDFPMETITTRFSPTSGKMFAILKMKANMEVFKGDKLYPTVIVENSTDATKRYSARAGVYRRICSNGLVVPDRRFKSKTIRALHKKNSLDFTDILEKITEMVGESKEAILHYKKYGKVKLTKEEFLAMERRKMIFSEKQWEDVLALPLVGANDKPLNDLFQKGAVPVWQIYNAGTQFITHGKNQNPETQIDRGMELTSFFDEIVGVEETVN